MMMMSYSLQVYYYLLKVYLQPPEPSMLGLSSFKDGLKPEPNLPEALRIMEEHAGCIDTAKVRFTILDLVPAEQNLHLLA